MKTVLTVVGILSFIAFFEAGIWAVLTFAKEKREGDAREGYPWDWTKEDEQKAQEMMELICDKCHEPYRGWSQDELDIACARCKVTEEVYELARGHSPSSATSGHLPPLGEGQRAVEDAGPYKSGRKEARE